MSARYLYKSLQYLDVINTVENYSRAKTKRKEEEGWGSLEQGAPDVQFVKNWHEIKRQHMPPCQVLAHKHTGGSEAPRKNIQRLCPAAQFE